MTALVSAFFLIAGAATCLIAAVGVLRLPDFFMRMHAATKAGGAGCGLLLIGVAFAEPSVGMWIKVLIAIVFLLLTTPIAGHLLGRAGYVAGVPLWGGTSEDQLQGELPRGDFERPPGTRQAAYTPAIDQVVLGLAHGRGMEAAISHALELASIHRADLVGLAIIDTKMLSNVGPVPIGGNHYAARLRSLFITRARNKMAEAVQLFEQMAEESRIRVSVIVEEGDPIPILRGRLEKRVALVLPRHAWFDHGQADRNIEPASRLARLNIAQVEFGGENDAPIVVFG